MAPIDIEKYDPAVEPSSDKAHRFARAVLGSLPILSGAAVEILCSIIEDPYNARRTSWLHALTEELCLVSDKIESVRNDTKRNSEVLSVILQSTDIAMKTGDKNIHKALIRLIRAAIESSDINEDLIAIYLSTIRQLTSSHFALLRLISGRQRHKKGDILRAGEDLSEQEELLFTEIRDCSGISSAAPPERLLSDLKALTLIESPTGSPASLGGSTNYCTTQLSALGKNFLNYVSEA